MTLLALGLILAGAITDAGWNLLYRRVRGGLALTWVFTVAATVLYAPVIIGIVIIEKPQFGRSEWIFCGATGFFHLSYTLLVQAAYRRESGDLSLVYPTVRATGLTLSTLAAIVILSERPSGYALVGGILIVIGLFFLTGGIHQFHRRRDKVLLILALLAGVLIAAYTLWDTYAVAALMIPPLLVDYFSKLTRLVVMAPYAYRNWANVSHVWSTHRFEVIGIAVLNPASYWLILSALAFTPVSYVAPAREVSVVLVVLLGGLLLNEKKAFRRLPWSIRMMLGLMLLAID